MNRSRTKTLAGMMKDRDCITVTKLLSWDELIARVNKWLPIRLISAPSVKEVWQSL